jgi:O-antigen/teichoic acid export membrane protein
VLKGSLDVVSSLRKTPFIKKFLILIADRGVQLLSQLFNIFVLANFLGPAEFGVLLYSISIYGLILSISNVGLDRVLVIELSHNNHSISRSELITSSLLIKSFFSIVILTTLYFGESFFLTLMSESVYHVLLMLSISLLFSSWIIIDAFNQSKNDFNLTAIARMAAAFLMLAARGLMVYWNISFDIIVLSFVAEQAICLLIATITSKGFISSLVPVSLFRLRSIMLSTMKSGLFVMLSTVCIVIYFRTSQAIVERNFDLIFLGVYSLVIYIVEVPVSLSSIMATIFTPRLTQSIVNDKQESTDYPAKILSIFILAGLLSTVGIILVGFIVALFLGPAYNGFLPTLLKASTALPIIFIGYFFNIYLLCSKIFNRYLVITFAGAAAALLFLYIAKSYVTKETAVYLYVLSQLLASFIIPLLFYKPLRGISRRVFSSFGRGKVLNDLKPIFFK